MAEVEDRAQAESDQRLLCDYSQVASLIKMTDTCFDVSNFGFNDNKLGGREEGKREGQEEVIGKSQRKMEAACYVSELC